MARRREAIKRGSELEALTIGGPCSCAGNFIVHHAWTPKVCKIIAFLDMYSGFGPLLYILWGSIIH